MFLTVSYLFILFPTIIHIAIAATYHPVPLIYATAVLTPSFAITATILLTVVWQKDPGGLAKEGPRNTEQDDASNETTI